jgi:hypothetical protein
MTTPDLKKPCGFQPKERAAAKLAGESTYFTNRPCKHGHFSLRSTISGVCFECAKRIQRQSLDRRLAANPDLYKQRYAKNPNYYRKKSAKYREKNPEKMRQISLNQNIKRKPQKAAYESARQARKIQATPVWLTKENWKQIENIYVAAKETALLAGFDCQVDHIVPLRGKDVCGLHVPWNLRITSRSYNSKKRNNFDEGVFFAPSLSGGILVHSSALPWNWRK